MAVEVEATAYLPKPFGIETFLDAIRGSLAGRRRVATAD